MYVPRPQPVLMQYLRGSLGGSVFNVNVTLRGNMQRCFFHSRMPSITENAFLSNQLRVATFGINTHRVSLNERTNASTCHAGVRAKRCVAGDIQQQRRVRPVATRRDGKHPAAAHSQDDLTTWPTRARVGSERCAASVH